MGAWNAGPRDNDTALDHELHIFGCEGRDDIGSQEPDEWRYVAWLVTQLRPDFPHLQEHVEQSLRRLDHLLKNDEYLDRWKNREAIEASIGVQVAELQTLKGEAR